MANEEIDVKGLDFELTKMLKYYLSKLVEYKGSDLHVKAGSTIRGRINGEITPLSKQILSYKDSVTLAKELLRSRFPELVEKKSVDFTFKLNDDYRFRVNIFFQVDGVSAVFRTIPMVLPTIETLQLPEIVHKFCSIPRGLILVTGPTGSGKTTTLASIINEINRTKRKHIITVEDPVEFVYKDDKSIVNQRAIGQDALSFSDSLRAALREDPDVILVGEMRDLETIETALHAAETGHLVLSTLHTVDAKETINRIIGMFPGEEHNRIQMSLSAVLQGVISQRLLRREDGGRIAAVEILVKNARIDGLIMEGRDSEIPDAIAEGKDIYKSQTFDQALLEHYANGVISRQEALNNASVPNDLKMKLDYYDAEKAHQRKTHNLKNEDLNEKERMNSFKEDSDIIGLKK